MKFQKGDTVKCSSKCPKEISFKRTTKIREFTSNATYPYWTGCGDFKASELVLVKKAKIKK